MYIIRAILFILFYSLKVGLAFILAAGLFVLIHMRAPSLIIWLNSVIDSGLTRLTEIGVPEWLVALAITLGAAGHGVFTIFFVICYSFVILLTLSFTDKGRFT